MNCWMNILPNPSIEDRASAIKKQMENTDVFNSVLMNGPVIYVKDNRALILAKQEKFLLDSRDILCV